MRSIGPFLREAWRLAAPYWRSEERWKARSMLLGLIVLNLSMVGMNVLLTYWQRAFYNALQNKDWNAFIQLLFVYRHDPENGRLPGFCFVAALFILVAVYQLYLNQALQIRWRRWLTEHYLTRWLAGRAYYRMSLTDAGTDNPDQRIADDISDFVSDTLSLALGLLSTVVTLFSFIFVLWGLSGPLAVFGVNIPGYMVWVALIYSVIGTWLAHLIGKPLIKLNFQQQRVEADFRYALVRLRENTEGVALYGGEADEHRGLTQRFRALMENWWAIMIATKRLTFFTAGFGQVASIFPIVVAAPAYFAGKMQLGGLVQTASAFGQVQGSLSWFVDNYSRLAGWRATVDRLTGFHHATGVLSAEAGTTGLHQEKSNGPEIALQDMGLALPDGRLLLAPTDISFRPGEAVLIGGASGSGKSTLFRALAGIWPYGQGTLKVPAGARMLFLPQRAYLPLGTLRRAVCYPDSTESFTDEAVRQALQDAGLGQLADQLDKPEQWDRRLSGGEQQRVALARALLLKPDWLFLDEATASLDGASEASFYQMLKEKLPNTTLVSIAHRPDLARFHDRVLRLQGHALAPAE